MAEMDNASTEKGFVRHLIRWLEVEKLKDQYQLAAKPQLTLSVPTFRQRRLSFLQNPTIEVGTDITDEILTELSFLKDL